MSVLCQLPGRHYNYIGRLMIISSPTTCGMPSVVPSVTRTHHLVVTHILPVTGKSNIGNTMHGLTLDHPVPVSSDRSFALVHTPTDANEPTIDIAVEGR